MKKLLGIGALILIAIIGWQVGIKMTPVGLHMMIGFVFGIVVALLFLIIATGESNPPTVEISTAESYSPKWKAINESDVYIVAR